MRFSLPVLLLLSLLGGAASAQQPPPASDNRANLTIGIEPLGDADQGVVARVTFRFSVPADVAEGVPLVVTGSYLRGAGVLKNFRLVMRPDQPGVLTTVTTLPVGEITVEARLMVPLEEQAPVILGKSSKSVALAQTNTPYVAGDEATAEGVLAEGLISEHAGAVRIRNPRRDVAPNLFIVDVAVKPPVKRVEFWVEGKKILARSAPPYRAELDLGKLPKRVEVRAVGYDERGRYVDADAFVVNERESQLEIKITRTTTPDGVEHFKLSVQNPRNNEIRSVVFFAGQKKLHEWKQPPYALDIHASKLQGVEFVRASVTDSTNYEASDLLFLSGERYIEEIEVNLVELPVSVTDPAGLPVIDLKQENFTVLENGKTQKITAFHFATNLPLSVGVLLDHSGSMKDRLADAKTAAIQFFRSVLKPRDQAFFGAFAFDATKLAPFVSDVSLVENQVSGSPQAEGGTSLYDAIVTGLYRFRSIQGRKALVIITDGEDTTSRLPYEDMLTYAQAARVPLYFVGVGMGFTDIGGTSRMKALAAETGGMAYFIRDVKQLSETYAQLEKDLRSQYVISYHTESSRKDQKYRPVEVKVDRPDAKVRTIRGFIP